MPQRFPAPSHWTGTETRRQDMTDMRFRTAAVQGCRIAIRNGDCLKIVQKIVRIIQDSFLPLRKALQERFLNRKQLIVVAGLQCLTDPELILACHFPRDAAQSLFDRLVFVIAVQNKLTVGQKFKTGSYPWCSISVKVNSRIAQIISPLQFIAYLLPQIQRTLFKLADMKDVPAYSTLSSVFYSFIYAD